MKEVVLVSCDNAFQNRCESRLATHVNVHTAETKEIAETMLIEKGASIKAIVVDTASWPSGMIVADLIYNLRSRLRSIPLIVASDCATDVRVLLDVGATHACTRLDVPEFIMKVIER